jgi:hypothetical protein
LLGKSGIGLLCLVGAGLSLSLRARAEEIKTTYAIHSRQAEVTTVVRAPARGRELLTKHYLFTKIAAGFQNVSQVAVNGPVKNAVKTFPDYVEHHRRFNIVARPKTAGARPLRLNVEETVRICRTAHCSPRSSVRLFDRNRELVRFVASRESEDLRLQSRVALEARPQTLLLAARALRMGNESLLDRVTR